MWGDNSPIEGFIETRFTRCGGFARSLKWGMLTQRGGLTRGWRTSPRETILGLGGASQVLRMRKEIARVKRAIRACIAPVQRLRRKLRPRGATGFPKNVLQVSLDCFSVYSKFIGDFLVRKSLGGPDHDFDLPPAKIRLVILRWFDFALRNRLVDCSVDLFGLDKH